MTHQLEEEWGGILDIVARQFASTPDEIVPRLVTLANKMNKASFRTWLEEGLRSRHIDETSIDLLKALCRVRRAPPEMEEEDNDDSVFTAPLPLDDATKKRRAPEEGRLGEKTHDLVVSTSIGEAVKKRKATASTSSSRSIPIARTNRYSMALDDDDDDEDDVEEDSENAEKSTFGDKHATHVILVCREGKRDVSLKYWLLNLLVHNDRDGDGFATEGSIDRTSLEGDTLFVMGRYRKGTEKTRSGNDWRRLLVITLASVSKKEVRLRARGYFKAGSRYKKVSPYYNVTDPEPLNDLDDSTYFALGCRQSVNTAIEAFKGRLTSNGDHRRMSASRSNC
jgi:hypothetical protein